MPVKGISKFEHSEFYGDWRGWGGFNKQKYTKEEALKVWREDLFGFDEDIPFVIEDAFVRYRFGRNEDNEPMSCWWIEWQDYGDKSVPVWSIRRQEPWEKEQEEAK
ncbi:TPA: hypothetical protein QFC31_001326 [Enterococcus faecium]